MRFTPQYKTDAEALQALIAKGEGVQLDFKQSISSQKKIARTLAAFANNRGGKLLVGVRDNGDISGCDPEEEMYMLYEAAEHFCEPPVDVAFCIYETEEGMSVLEAEVLNSLRKPHFALDEQDEWQLYMRSADKTVTASKSTQKMLEQEDSLPGRSGLDSKERFVLEYLERYATLLPRHLAQRLNISLQRANALLVQLAGKGLILEHRDDRGIYYSLR